MPFDTGTLTRDSFAIPAHELTEGELEAISGGKPAKNPPPPPQDYLKVEIKDAFVTSV